MLLNHTATHPTGVKKNYFFVLVNGRWVLLQANLGCKQQISKYNIYHNIYHSIAGNSEKLQVKCNISILLSDMFDFVVLHYKILKDLPKHWVSIVYTAVIPFL